MNTKEAIKLIESSVAAQNLEDRPGVDNLPLVAERLIHTFRRGVRNTLDISRISLNPLEFIPDTYNYIQEINPFPVRTKVRRDAKKKLEEVTTKYKNNEFDRERTIEAARLIYNYADHSYGLFCFSGIALHLLMLVRHREPNFSSPEFDEMYQKTFQRWGIDRQIGI